MLVHVILSVTVQDKTRDYPHFQVIQLRLREIKEGVQITQLGSDGAVSGTQIL